MYKTFQKYKNIFIFDRVHLYMYECSKPIIRNSNNITLLRPTRNKQLHMYMSNEIINPKEREVYQGFEIIDVYVTYNIINMYK